MNILSLGPAHSIGRASPRSHAGQLGLRLGCRAYAPCGEDVHLLGIR